METQNLGIDIGRGYAKIYTIYNNIPKECLFKSIVGLGRHMDTSKYENPIDIEYNGIEYFIGELGEKEGYNPTQNLTDSKVTQTVNILIAAALSKVALSDRVKIVLGVPNKMFSKKTMDEVIAFYKGKKYEIKDKTTNSYRKVVIEDITIFRESDAALIWYTKDRDTMDKPLGVVSVGFRSSEFSYFDENFRFNDKFSKTKELGNKTALEFIQKKLSEVNIMREVSEIDSSNKYDELKDVAYDMLREAVEIEIENTWINISEMEIKIAGGVPNNFKDFKYEIIEDPQMATAKGLFYVAEELL